MTIGTNNKKQLIFLVVLVVIMAYFLYTNVLSGPSTPTPSQRSSAPLAGVSPTAVPSVTGSPAVPSSRRAGSHDTGDEWHPVYLDPNPAKRPDVSKIDPTLRLDLFAKVQSVDLAGGARNLFQFSAAPPKVETAAAKPAGEEPRVWVFVGPKQPPPPQPPPPPPPPPPITLKFYGFSLSKDSGKRVAYLLDGEDIFLASEGETLKRKYKILRIQANSILVEDLDAKRQQSVPLTEEGQG
jgi:hypothetical protein